MTKIIKKEYICPITSLPVVEINKYLNVEIEEGYYFNIRKIGASIVHIQNKGNARQTNLQKHYDLVEQFAKDAGIENDFVEIRDMTYIKGKPSSTQIKYQKTYFASNDHRLSGFVLCCAPFWLKTIVIAAFKTYRSKTKFASADNYKHAVFEAQQILTNISNNNTSSLSTFIPTQDKKRKIVITSDDLNEFHHFCGNLLWLDKSNSKQPSLLSAKNPLSIFSEALDTVRQDIIDIRERDYQHTIDLSNICESIQVGVIITQHDTHKIVFANTAASKMINIPIDNIVGKISHNFICPITEYNHDLENTFAQLSKNEDILITAKGDKVPIYKAHRTLQYKQQSCTLQTFINISQIKKTQQELMESNQELVRNKANLISMAKKADEANQAKSDFLANMSHEIRTPLNGILGIVELLKDSSFSSEENEMLETIRSCGNNLLHIVNDILDFSKIEANKIELEKITFDLDRSIRNIIHLTSYAASQKGLNLKFNISEEVPPFLIGDITRITQILTNLLSNAVKFTKHGTVKLNIECDDSSLEQPIIKFIVIDTGIGIKNENQEKLFHAFTQADTSTTRKYGGTGLGLAISMHLTQIMGGKIHLESNEGKGTVFTVVLPLKKGNLIQSHKKNMMNDFPHRILVVEDTLMNQKIISKLLASFGYHCDLVSNGAEAVKTLKNRNDYTIIFMDMQMPVMDGITATKIICKMYGKKKPTIIAMTANSSSQDRKKCFNVGMDDFVTKPINTQKLQYVLRESYHSIKSLKKDTG